MAYNPSCPECRTYNALLPNTQSLVYAPELEIRKCRDCNKFFDQDGKLILPQPITMKQHFIFFNMGYKDRKRLEIDGYTSQISWENWSTNEHKSYIEGWNSYVEEGKE